MLATSPDVRTGERGERRRYEDGRVPSPLAGMSESLFITQHASSSPSSSSSAAAAPIRRRKMVSQSADIVSIRHMLATQMKVETENLKHAKEAHGVLAASISHLSDGLETQKNELTATIKAKVRKEQMIEESNKRLAFATEDGKRKQQVNNNNNNENRRT